MIDRQDILHLFASQHWVADSSQLRARGVSRRTEMRARERGLVHAVLPGVVQLTGAPTTFRTQAMALQLHGGSECFLSGVTAGALHGLRKMPTSPIEITVWEDHAPVMPPWGRRCETSWVDLDRDIVRRADGLRVASPLRMLFRLARVFNDHRFERAAEDAWHRQLLTPQDAADYLAVIRQRGKWGVSRFEGWLEKTVTRPRPSQSALELDVLDAIRRAGLPEPERQHELTLPTNEVIKVDLAWPDVRLGVEPGHSWWHGGDLGQRADQARDRACDEIGWRIIRCDESVQQELAAFGLQLRIIYEERLRSLRPR